nr:uncharacterized protein LOC109159167 [Ipomoea batatas]
MTFSSRTHVERRELLETDRSILMYLPVAVSVYSRFAYSFDQRTPTFIGHISPNGHRILACYPQIYKRHDLLCTMKLFRFVFLVRPLSPKHEGGVLCIQSWGHLCTIADISDNNKGWKDRVLSIKYPWPLPIPRTWPTHAIDHTRPIKTRAFGDADVKISAKTRSSPSLRLLSHLTTTFTANATIPSRAEIGGASPIHRHRYRRRHPFPEVRGADPDL